MRKEYMVDLNEENVARIFKYCTASILTPAKNAVVSSFYSNNNTSKKIKFHKEKLLEMQESVQYMLGQLMCVHKKREFMILTDGFKKYTGKNWTEDKTLLFSLYYLGVATNHLPAFEPSDDGSNDYFAPISKQLSLKPTISPNDPELENWLAWQENSSIFIEENKKIFNSQSYKNQKDAFYNDVEKFLGSADAEAEKAKDNQLEVFLTNDQLKTMSKAEIQNTVDKITNQKPFAASLIIENSSNDKNFDNWFSERREELEWKAELSDFIEENKVFFSSPVYRGNREELYKQYANIFGAEIAKRLKEDDETFEYFLSGSQVIKHMSKKEAREYARRLEETNFILQPFGLTSSKVSDKIFDNWNSKRKEILDWKTNLSDYIEYFKEYFNSQTYKNESNDFFEYAKNLLGIDIAKAEKVKEEQLASFLTNEQLKYMSRSEAQAAIDKITYQPPLKVSFSLKNLSYGNNFDFWFVNRREELVWQSKLSNFIEENKRDFSSKEFKEGKKRDYITLISNHGREFADLVILFENHLENFLSNDQPIKSMSKQEAKEYVRSVEERSPRFEIVKAYRFVPLIDITDLF